jgi:hypothetical protein
MHYFNKFVHVHKIYTVDALTLSATCFFLMSKVEHFPIRLRDLISVAFEVEPESEEAKTWHEVIVRLESVVCEALGFDFLVPHPMDLISAKAPAQFPKVKELAVSLYTYTPMTMISRLVDTQTLAAGLLFMAADALGCAESLSGVVVTVEGRELVRRAAVEVLAFRGRSMNVERIDAMIRQAVSLGGVLPLDS